MEAGVGAMGTKLGKMSYLEPSGTVIPITVVEFSEGNIVTQVESEANDGYDGVQEFRLLAVDGFEVTRQIDFKELFEEGDFVNVSGTKGFQGNYNDVKFGTDNCSFHCSKF
ncbi:large ribosomal subunit protein uL3c-like [Nicotiana tabacum]|uniref:Large ribosomal subunit protein uL3c-like n=1 Tax=Nicotiana tabacum TaxID=4097 RepID=A0AC58TEA4_TOBAC